jgi:hypothetical protein
MEMKGLSVYRGSIRVTWSGTPLLDIEEGNCALLGYAE